MVIPTSKMSLKVSCLRACNNDLDKAKKLYEYLASDTELPDVDVPVPTFMDSAKKNLSDLYSWVKNNGGDIYETYKFIKTLKNG